METKEVLSDSVALGSPAPKSTEVRIVVGGINPTATALRIIEMVQDELGENLAADITLDEKRQGSIIITGFEAAGYYEEAWRTHVLPCAVLVDDSRDTFLGLSERRSILELVANIFNSAGTCVHLVGDGVDAKLGEQVSVYGPAPHRSMQALRRNARNYRGKKSKGR
jgi:hypothetical protein